MGTALSTLAGVTAPLCPSCGADAVPARERCPACGRPVAQAFLRPTLSPDAEAVEYEFGDWSDADRAVLTDTLGATGIAFRWEPDLTLAVAASREDEADNLIDELRASGGGDGDGDDSDDEGGPLPPAADAWGEGEDAFSALGDLYDAADRLFHAPASVRAALDLDAAADAIANASPPFGFNPVLWRTAGELAEQLRVLIDDGASNEDIQAGAEALRDVLAEHV
jgi:hypothetical protein